MVKVNREFWDNLFFTVYVGWLFAMEWIWENSLGRNVMVMYFGSNVTLKIAHFIWYLSCPTDNENCCGQIVKWIAVIGSLLKFVDIRQVTIGKQRNNGTKGEYNQLTLNLVCHFFNLAYILTTILYFYFKKRREQQKQMPHVYIGASSTSYI